MKTLVQERQALTTRALAAERERDEWKARFDTLLLGYQRREVVEVSLAERIARRLFTSGSQERAQRLVLTVDRPDKRDLGGWSELVAVDQILAVMVSRDTEGNG